MEEDIALMRSSGPGSARVYGLDVLYWQSTEHLLTEPSHSAAVQVLDRFIQAHGERLIRDPFKRCLLQRDLWRLFDWAAMPGSDLRAGTNGPVFVEAG
jgi:hypothetical protein